MPHKSSSVVSCLHIREMVVPAVWATKRPLHLMMPGNEAQEEGYCHSFCRDKNLAFTPWRPLPPPPPLSRRSSRAHNNHSLQLSSWDKLPPAWRTFDPPDPLHHSLPP